MILLFKKLSIYFYARISEFASVLQCTAAIAQLTKGKSKEDKDKSQVQSLAAKVLEKDYKQRAPEKLPQVTTALKSLTLTS